MRKAVFLFVPLIVLLAACSKEPPDPVVGAGTGSPVNFNEAEVPYATLSEYGLFKLPLKDLDPVIGVLPYEVITPLFTDHAKKSRFIWMRSGARAVYAGDDEPLTFDDGTVLIKNFFYDGVQPSNERRSIETRLMFKRNGTWEFANYVWNAEQTEAHLDLQGSNLPITWLNDDGVEMSVDYRIPSFAECLACHKKDSRPYPIGTKPQNLARPIASAGGTVDQLQRWVQAGYLEPGLPMVSPIVDWQDVTKPLQDRVRAYLEVNCSHCHADQKYCDYRPIRFAWTETTDPIALGICVPPDEPITPGVDHIVSAGSAASSMLHYRLNATEENVRMPLLGRSLIHQEAVDLIADWINSLDPPCN